MSKQKQFVYTASSELVIFMYLIRNSLNSVLSYCGLVDAKIRASEIDLPVVHHAHQKKTPLFLPYCV